jgi:hypothetical protein
MLSPLYGQLSPLRVPTKAVRQVQDSDAITYIAAVETADGQSLEAAVQYAYEDFILGCKADSIWTAIKASCILAGARTLSGALAPLVGAAPTNNNFVSGDYDRAGLLGNATTKRLNTNRHSTADPQDNMHMSVYLKTIAGNYHLAATEISANGVSQLIDSRVRNRSVSINGSVVGLTAPQFLGATRNSSANFTHRRFATNTTYATASQTSVNSNYFVFSGSATTSRSSSRIAFYSIGESLDLALLNARVSTLMTDLAAAIS